MRGLDLVRWVLLASILILAGRGPAALADDKAAIAALKQQRRDALKRLEEDLKSSRDNILDEFRDVHAVHRHRIEQAEKDYKKAELDRIKAEYDVRDYREGIARQDLATAEGEIAQAKDDEEKAGEQLKALQDAKQNGKLVHDYEIERATLTLRMAMLDREQAETQLFVLTRYTAPRETSRRDDLVRAAKSMEQEKRGAWEREKAIGEKVEALLQRSHAQSAEDFVVFLINDAVNCEEQVVKLTQEALGVEPLARARPGEAGAVDQLKQKRDAVVKLMDQAKGQLVAAAQLGNHLHARRLELAAAEARLKRERAIVDAAEQADAPRP